MKREAAFRRADPQKNTRSRRSGLLVKQVSEGTRDRGIISGQRDFPVNAVSAYVLLSCVLPLIHVPSLSP